MLPLLLHSGDLAVEIARLKEEPGKEILAHGGARFAQSLVKLGLIDEYRLLIHPEALASNGARVTMLDVNPQRIEIETKRLRGAGLDVRGQTLDVTDHKALDAAFDEIVGTYGRLDVVFANAGIDPGAGFVGAWVGSERPRVPEGALENYTDERLNMVI